MEPVDERLAREWHDWDELKTHLRFSPRDGRIWLDNGRMLLIDVETITAIRRELIDSLGTVRARGILTRIGIGTGNRDAKLARHMRPDATAQELLAMGPRMHSLKGAVAVEPIRFDVSVEHGHYSAEFNWRDSSEVDSHVTSYGRSAEPVCWMQIGYASGYISALMGKEVLHREVQCRAMGHPFCKVVGKPVDEWTDAEEDLYYFGLRASLPPLGVAAPPTGSYKPKSTAFGDLLVGASSGFVGTCHMIERVAGTNATVLLLGETGVGKEMFARALHKISDRSKQPFIAINCAALPENLVEAELFGVEKGAFTGADQSRLGRFERANGGTLFLDEISALNLAAQAKLLRALQEREIERVGDVRSRKVDIRLVAATNIDLYEEAAAGRFRNDLLFRLDVFPVHIPPLRERSDDIPVLIEHFLKRFTVLHKRSIIGFTERAVRALLEYDYPGNIRELENMVERGVLLASDGSALDIGHLFTKASNFVAARANSETAIRLETEPLVTLQSPGTMEGVVEKILEGQFDFDTLESLLVEKAVAKAGGNLALAARLLGVSRSQVAYRCKKTSGRQGTIQRRR